jgi:catechol 2,3-dioxygenase
VAHVYEPNYDVAHFSHIELLTPRPEESQRFFTDVLSLQVVGQQGQSVYLRGYGDYERSTLTLTEAPAAGLGHAAFRCASLAALDRRVQQLGDAGRWVDGETGHGPAYQFRGPDGHLFELFYETTRFAPSASERPYLKNQPQRLPHGGARARQLDHLNLLSSDVLRDRSFFQEQLGFRLSEHIVMDNGRETGAWLRVTSKSYDLVFTQDATSARGRLHHLAYRLDNREDVLRAADLYTEHGIPIENGPGKHPIGQTFFVYVYEPGGNRVELCAGGYQIFAPDWQPVRWSEAERARGQAWGAPTVASFHTYGTPLLNGLSSTQENR